MDKAAIAAALRELPVPVRWAVVAASRAGVTGAIAGLTASTILTAARRLRRIRSRFA